MVPKGTALKLAFNIAAMFVVIVGIALFGIYPTSKTVHATSPSITYEPVGFDISNASFIQSFSIAAKETTSTGMAFNTDGTKMYVIGTTSDAVHQYSLSTGFNISTASFVQSKSIAAQTINSSGIAFNTDGTKMYVIGAAPSGAVHQYNLSTGFDISTASFVQSKAAKTISSSGVTFNSNGSRMFVSNPSAVYQYDLSTNFDISTASFVESKSTLAQDSAAGDIVFSPDGKKMFMVGASNDRVYQYSATDIAANGFVENGLNEGGVAGKIAFRLSGDTFQDTDNDNLLDVGSEVTVNNIPAGLTPVITLSQGDSVGTLTLTGKATNHENTNDVADITFQFDNSTFVGGDASAVSGATGPASSGAGINFNDSTPFNIERVSVDSFGRQGNLASTSPSISSDGQYVAYVSSATNLVNNDTNTESDIFLYNTANSTTKRISVDSTGSQGTEFIPTLGSTSPSISSDGRFIAYQSRFVNLVAGDTNGLEDIFLYDTLTAVTTRVSISTAGAQGTGGLVGSTSPSINSDGRFIAYESRFPNLVDGDTNGVTDIFLYDTLLSTNTRVSVDSFGNESDGNSNFASISGDGRYVAYQSDADNLPDSGDANGVKDIFLYDTWLGVSSLVSVDSAGVQADQASDNPAISSDGRYVTYASDATNLVTGDTNGVKDIFLYDTVTGVTKRVSVDSGGTEADGSSYTPSISSDGRYITYSSDATNLVAGDANGATDIFVYDTVTGVTTRFSVDSAETEGTGGAGSVFPSINGNGRYVAYASSFTNLVTGDTNAVNDIFLTSMTTYVLTYTAGSNGTVTGSTPQTVRYGFNGNAVTAVPNTGYHFVNWSDGSTANPRTDTNILADLTVTANFAIDTKTLTYSAGSHGSVTGTSPQTVNYGSNGTVITAVPDIGYHFVNWSDASTANPRTDTNVVANVTVTANFAADPVPTPVPATPGSSSGSSGTSSSGSSTSSNITTSEPDTDSIPNDIENAGPNGGDANGDGILDSKQNNVASFFDKVTGSYSVLEVADSCTVQSILVTAESANTTQDSKFTYPLGLMNFTIKCNEPGQTVPVTQYYYSNINPDSLVMRKYYKTDQTYRGIVESNIKQVIIDSKPVIKTSYFITDGGKLDEDGLKNQVIVDPSGPAQKITANSTSSTKSQAKKEPSSILLYVVVAVVGIVGIILIVTTVRKRRKVQSKVV